jgi:hypothetical protein
VTWWPPGFTVSVVSSEASPLPEIDTVTLWPAASVPELGETVSSPSRLAGSEMDHETGPPSAVRVSELPSSGVSTTVLGDTVSVPAAGDCTGGDDDGGGDEDGGGAAGEDEDGGGAAGEDEDGAALGGDEDPPLVGVAELPGDGWASGVSVTTGTTPPPPLPGLLPGPPPGPAP